MDDPPRDCVVLTFTGAPASRNCTPDSVPLGQGGVAATYTALGAAFPAPQFAARDGCSRRAVQSAASFLEAGRSGAKRYAAYSGSRLRRDAPNPIGVAKSQTPISPVSSSAKTLNRGTKAGFGIKPFSAPVFTSLGRGRDGA